MGGKLAYRRARLEHSHAACVSVRDDGTGNGREIDGTFREVGSSRISVKRETNQNEIYGLNRIFTSREASCEIVRGQDMNQSGSVLFVPQSFNGVQTGGF